jgi:hypothetical protein
MSMAIRQRVVKCYLSMLQPSTRDYWIGGVSLRRKRPLLRHSGLFIDAASTHVWNIKPRVETRGFCSMSQIISPVWIHLTNSVVRWKIDYKIQRVLHIQSWSRKRYLRFHSAKGHYFIKLLSNLIMRSRELETSFVDAPCKQSCII